MNNLGTEILLTQLKAVHESLELTMDGVTNEVANFIPPHKANPIAGTYAHLIFSEDLFMHAFMMDKKPLFETDFAEKTGASALQPTDWENAYPHWLKEVTIDVDQFRAYAKAVYSATETYVSSLSDADLEQEVDLTSLGMGTRKAYDFIANFISGHAFSIMGEISVLKGIQGLKGYPF